jgi:hypothetical protein
MATFETYLAPAKTLKLRWPLVITLLLDGLTETEDTPIYREGDKAQPPLYS